MTLCQLCRENVSVVEAYRGGINQKELARRLDVTPGFVSQLLSGHRRPGLDTLENVAKALGVEPRQLLEKLTDRA